MASCLDDPFLSDIAQSAGRSNTESLSPHAKKVVKGAIQQIDAELHTVDEEITRLLAKRRRIIALSQNLEVAYAYHKWLPSEILGHIFSFLVEPSSPGIRISGFRSYEAWPIRAVCSTWRNIALEERSLWDSVILSPIAMPYSPPGTEMTSWRCQFSTARQILPKKGDVSVAIKFPRRYDHFLDVALEDFVYPLTHRLRSLRVEGGPRIFMKIIQTASPMLFSQLRTVELSLDTGSGGIPVGSAPAEHVRSILRSAPNLSYLRLKWECSTGFHDLFTQWFNVQIPWSQIVHLDIVSLTIDTSLPQLASALRAVQKLRKLSIFFSRLLGASLEVTPIKFPHLQYLDVHALHSSVLPLLDLFTTPVLHHLKVAGHDRHGVDNYLATLSKLIHRSHCTLRFFEEQATYVSQPIDSSLWDFISDLDGLESFSTNRIATVDLLNKIAAGGTSINCQYQKWCFAITPTSPISAATTAIANGLANLGRNADQREPIRTLCLELFGKGRLQEEDWECLVSFFKEHKFRVVLQTASEMDDSSL